ncbi:hypothetical protein [Crocosphaera chwakensis]|uniref:Uncharacterized protein n=1 Tax=Crocosphaera chwakensis CCY0110 TaxID=391612 RepID=A3IKS0_9CHRO|nr:hypothetical protein [Crocosphaera chwakensis]EAZ92789.1 hypothetical protein CY0110_21872 [Crocosphaera chwakensis CCY0110]
MSNIIISDLEKINNKNQITDVLPHQQKLVKGGEVEVMFKITIRF